MSPRIGNRSYSSVGADSVAALSLIWRRANPTGAIPDDGFYMRGSAYNWDLQPTKEVARPPFITQSGLLDGNFFKRTHWNFPGGYASVLTLDDTCIYSFRMFDSTRALTSEVYFTPGTKGYGLLKYDRRPRNNHKVWETRVPLRAPATLSTPNRIFLGGIPDVAPADDPYAAFSGRLGGELYVMSAADGTVEQKLKIPGEPVFNGMAATPGRLFLALRTGTVVGLTSANLTEQ